tara:strand:+ start:214 stop:327 length:114 start_codon:yes stop_codon:yes gene_type:complete
MYALADRLHKTVSEIEEMSYSEMIGWIVYLEAINKNG